ncbi:anthranilate synthase component I, partial [Anaerostipes hadrus]|nr:anthranilate synthase component I [Anaerostipes hadrus]
LKEYQMVPVFYEVLADNIPRIRMFRERGKEGTPFFMLGGGEIKNRGEEYSFIGLNLRSKIRIPGKDLEVDGLKQKEEFKRIY